MSETNNPFETTKPPNPETNNNLQDRSSIPKVIGVISIVLGTLGLLFGLFGLASTMFLGGMMELGKMEGMEGMKGMDGMEALGMTKTYFLVTTVISVLTSIWAIFIGMKLLKYLDIGRQHYNYYTILAIIISIGTFFYTKSMMAEMFKDMAPEAAAAAGSMGTLSSLGAFIPPIILIIVTILLNQQNVKDSLSD